MYIYSFLGALFCWYSGAKKTVGPVLLKYLIILIYLDVFLSCVSTAILCFARCGCKCWQNNSSPNQTWWQSIASTQYWMDPSRYRQMHDRADTLTAWWRHQMETFSALLALCAGNWPVTGEIPSQWPVTQSFDIFFDLCLNKRPSKQSWGWWYETPSRPLWRHRNEKIYARDHSY